MAGRFIAEGMVFEVRDDDPNKVTLRSVEDGERRCFAIPSTVSHEGKEYAVSEVDADAFDWFNGFESIRIPAEIEFFPSGSIAECMNLSSIEVDEGNPRYSSVDGVLFDKSRRTLFKFPPRKSTSKYEIPDEVVECKRFAFQNCTELRSVEIPDSVEYIQDAPFLNCTNLARISVSEGNRRFADRMGVLLDLEKKRILQFPRNLELDCFIIPEGIGCIGPHAFEGALHLEKVECGHALSIETCAFRDCLRLGEFDAYYLDHVGEYAFENCRSLKHMDLDLMDEVEDNAFIGCPFRFRG